MSIGNGELRFYGRRCRIESGTTTLFQYAKGEGLRITAEINRTSDPEPDSAVIRIVNVATRRAKELAALLKPKPLPTGETQVIKIKVFAGYDDIGVSGLDELIYYGDILEVAEGRADETDTYLELICGDGAVGLRDGFVNEGFGPGVSVDLVRKAALAAMKISDGIDAQIAMKEALGKNADVAILKNGMLAQCKAKDLMTHIVSLLGQKWWVRDGVLVQVPKEQATKDVAIELRPDKGLLGTPTIKETGDIEFRALLNPRIFPGRQVILKKWAGEFYGAPSYRVDKVRYILDTHDTAWHVEGYARQSVL